MSLAASARRRRLSVICTVDHAVAFVQYLVSLWQAEPFVKQSCVHDRKRVGLRR